MEKKYNNMIRTLNLLVVSVLLISITAAAGVVTPYWDDNPLKLAPGESDTVTLYLQNMVGDEDMVLRAELTSGSEVATLTNGPEYTVPLGTEDIPVNLKIEVPENADLGTKYDVALSFQQISDESGQMLHVASAFTSKVPVEIVGEQESSLYGKPGEGLNLVWAVIIILLLITLVSVFAIRKRKRKK